MHRFARRFLLFLVVATVLLLAGAAHAQATSTTSWKDILATWGDPWYWLFLLGVFACGAVGGLISELLSLRGRVEWPHLTRPDEVHEDLPEAVARFLFDLGVFARLLIGGGAAILVLWALAPEEGGATAVIACSLLAGASGGAVFQILKGRLEAALAAKNIALAEKEVEHTQALQAQSKLMLQDMNKLQTAMKTNLARATKSHQITETMTELAEIDRLLGGIQALNAATISRTRAPGG